MERMQAIVARHLPRTGATLRFDDGAYPPMTPTPGNEALLQVLDGASRDLGLGPVAALDPGEARRRRHRLHRAPAAMPRRTRQRRRRRIPTRRASTRVSTTLTPMAQRAAVLIYRLTR